MIIGRFECDNVTGLIIKEFVEMLPIEVNGATIHISAEMWENQGFRLTYDYDSSNATIHYKSKLDLCRALLYVVFERKKASFNIEQKCSFDDFGVMIDCSRNAVPKVRAMKKFICYSAILGYSYIGLYTEDTIEVENEPYFGYMRGRWKASEIRELDAYAHLFGIELRPYIQTLAHLDCIFHHLEYQKINDTDNILLIDDERTEKLLDNLIRSVSKMYQSRVINIGMDEAEMVGLGKYLGRYGYQNRQKLMRKHLDLVIKICKRYQLHPQIWSDMFFKLAFDGEYYIGKLSDKEKIRDRMNEISVPEDIDLIYWDYYHLKKDEYDNMIEAHKMLSANIGFAGGAWKWQGFVPNNRFSIKTGYQALKSCAENSIEKVVITCWGDNGAEADMFCVLPTLFMDAQFAWDSGRTEAPGEEDDKLFSGLTGYSLDEFLMLDDLNPYVYDGTVNNNASKFFLYSDPLLGICDSLVKEGTSELYMKATLQLERLRGRKSKFSYLFETAEALSYLLEKKADIGIRIKEAYDNKDKEELRCIQEEFSILIVRLDYFYEQLRKQWDTNNKSFGFEIQTIRIGGLRQRFIDVERILYDYLTGKSDSIQELEEERLPFDLVDGTVDNMNFNCWSKNVSTSLVCW